MEKESKKRPEVNYLSGVYRVRYWNKCSTRRWIGVSWMGCSCILDHNCPVSLRVYASRIPPCITMQRVSRVDKRNPVSYTFPLPPFFFRKGRKKKRQLRVEMLERKLQPIRQLRDRKERSLKNFSCPLIIIRFFSSNVAYFSRSR